MKKDPRSRATQAELAEQFRLLIAIRDKVSEANNAVRTIRNVKHQLALRTGGPVGGGGGGGGGTGPLADAARALAEQLSVIEDSIYQTKNRSGQDPLNYPIRLNNKIAALAGVVASADARPTTQSYSVFRELSAKLDGHLARLKAELGTEGQLAKVNALIEAANGSKILPATAEFIAVKKL